MRFGPRHGDAAAPAWPFTGTARDVRGKDAQKGNCLLNADR